MYVFQLVLVTRKDPNIGTLFKAGGRRSMSFLRHTALEENQVVKHPADKECLVAA